MKWIWKKVFGVALAAGMVLSLAACGQQGGNAPASGNQSSGQNQENASTPAPTESQNSEGVSAPDVSGSQGSQSTESGNVLVVFYSATGNTESVANDIAQATGGDLFEITPAEPYTSDDLNWTDDDSRVVYEYENPDARGAELVTYTPENWDEYDVVFLGYPIWWGIAAWPVDGFVEANDFSGKTVIPFCTSSSSGLGESGELLAQLAGTGSWLEGHRFRSGAAQADIEAWIEELDL